jgi:uncharacterized protein (UPF0332 family)
MDWQIYLEKAKGNLKVAQLALDAGEYDASVSRAYYGVFHAELAALLKLTDYRRKGKYWDHGNVHAELNRRLIRQQKVLPSRLADVPENLMYWRHVADCDADRVSAKNARQILAKGRDFV